ncbi:MAG: carboxypeptidase regulatory-like domain-containing protein [Bacteroidota bacterium]
MKSVFRLLFALWFCVGTLAVAQNNQYVLKIDPSATGSSFLAVTPGQVIQFTAKAYQMTAAGTSVVVPITSIVWTVDPASFGAITAQGVFTASAANAASPRGVIIADAVVGNMTLRASVALVMQNQPQNKFTFSGNVSSSAGPIIGAQVSVMGGNNTSLTTSTKTDNNGDFSIAVPAGTCKIHAQAAGYIAEYYDNVTTSALATTFVTDPANPVVNNINFILDVIPPTPVYTISGTVRDNNGNPIANALVQAEMGNSPNLRPFLTRSANDGSYSLDVISGTFTVWSNAYGFSTEYYNNTPDRTLAASVTVNTNAPTQSGVDFSLEPYGGSIAGTITDGNGNPIADAVVTAWINGRPSTSAANAAYGKAVSAANGSYLIAGLPPGDFVVRAQATGFIAEYYDDATDITLAAAVTVANQPVTGIDFELTVGGSISGMVRNEDTNAPLAYATVIVRSLQNHLERGARTDANGNYVVDGLPFDDYTVFASAYRFLGEYYNNSTTAALAGTVSVTGTTPVTGIDFALTPAPVAPRLYRGSVVARTGAGGLLTVVEAINPANGMVIATSTDPQGGFEFQAWDNAVLRARSLGYVGLYAGNTRDWKESRWEGMQTGMTFILDPVSDQGMAACSGQVTDAGNGTGIGNAWVYGMDAAGSIFFTVSGKSGSFSIPNAANGSLDVMVSEVGFESGATTTEIEDAHGSATISAQRTGVTSVNEEAALPASPVLLQNYPNPFNPATTIAYLIPERMHVSIRVYDLLGSEVSVLVDKVVNAGAHNLTWNASQLPSGIYLYRMEAASSIQTLRMTLLK